MKVFLMHPDRDFDAEQELPPNVEALTQDLELDTLLDAMAAGDEFFREIGQRALLTSLTDPDEIVYRQEVLADCFEQPAILRALYELAVEGAHAQRKSGMFFSLAHAGPSTILGASVRVLEILVDVLERLRKLGDEEAAKFHSPGFRRFFAMLSEELDDQYLAELRTYLKELKFDRGILISAQLGAGNKGVRHVLRRPQRRSLLNRLAGKAPPSFAFTIPPRDENGFKALDEIRNRGLNLVSNALGQSTDHVISFFRAMRCELAFYLACLNLHARLTEKGEPTCVPEAVRTHPPRFSTVGLYDAALTLHLEPRAVGNDVSADGKSLMMITGANQGGKSTFLRSVGIAQLMVQAGMFAPAASLSVSLSDGVFTHFKREEDETMESGKLDEELARMSEIADEITPDCLLLCNESFAATNEREGSEIARQVIRAMVEAGVRVFFVTHLYDLARSFSEQRRPDTIFLRAERRPDGARTFRVVEGEPLPTSYGADSYRRIFGALPEPVAARTAS